MIMKILAIFTIFEPLLESEMCWYLQKIIYHYFSVPFSHEKCLLEFGYDARTLYTFE